MPVGLPLDFAALLAPIAGDAPSGSSGIFFELRPRLEELRREVTGESRQFEEEELKTAEWAGIEKLTRETLSARAKDLRLAGYLIEALVKRYRFDGLAGGLELIRRLFVDAWDFLLPPIEDGDLSGRALPVENMLDAPDKGLRLPTAVRSVSMVRLGASEFSFLDWMRSQDAKEPTRAELAEAFAKAVSGTKPEAVTADAAAIDRCLEVLGQLTKNMEERLAAEAPTLQRLREALEDCRRLTKYVLQQIGGSARPDDNEKANIPTSGSGGGQDGAAHGASRDSLYQQLDRLAVQLERLEPHSPIPYLVRRAVRLGAMPFPQLIRALVRDANVVGELTREFGLPDEQK